MKKILLFTVLVLSFTSLSAVSVGVIVNSNFGNSNSGALTIGVDNLEFEISAFSASSFRVSADMMLINEALGEGFFFNFGAGAYIGLASSPLSVDLGLIAPLEFGYTFAVANGLDLYLQVTPAVAIFPIENIGFNWQSGLGLRFLL